MYLIMAKESWKGSKWIFFECCLSSPFGFEGESETIFVCEKHKLKIIIYLVHM
jgi:hypothetical protein